MAHRVGLVAVYVIHVPVKLLAGIGHVCHIEWNVNSDIPIPHIRDAFGHTLTTR